MKQLFHLLRNLTKLLPGLLLAASLAPSPVSAVTLDELMDLSMARRAVVSAYKAALQQSRHDINHARGFFLPELDTGYQFNGLGENDITLEEKTNNTCYATTRLNLFAGFKDINTLAAARKAYAMKDFEVKSIQQDIKRDVALCFLEVYYAKGHLKVTRDALNRYRKEYENMELKNRIGIAKKNDLLKIKVEMDNALQTVETAETAFSQSLNTLNMKTATKITPTDLDFNCFNAIPDLFDKEAYWKTLLKENSEINWLIAQIARHRINEKISRSAFYPTVDLTGGYKFHDACPDGSGDETRIQLDVSMNIFDGFRKNETLEKARLDIRKSTLELNELKSQLRTRLENYLLDFDVSVKNMGVARNSLAEAQEHFRITELSFDKGILTATDMLDSIYYLSRAKFNLLDAKVQVFRNHFNISRLIERL